MAPSYEKAEGNFQFGPLIKQRKFPDSTHEEGGNTTKAGAGNFCHSNSRIKHISGQWIFCYASAYAIQLLYDKFGEKNHDFLDSCWHVVFRKNAFWDFLLKRCWQQQHLFYTLTPSTWAFPSFYLYGLPGPHRRCHPRTRHFTAHRAHTAHIPASSWSLGLPDRSNDHNFRIASAIYGILSCDGNLKEDLIVYLYCPSLLIAIPWALRLFGKEVHICRAPFTPENGEATSHGFYICWNLLDHNLQANKSL